MEFRESLSPSECSRPVGGRGAEDEEERGVSGGWVGEGDVGSG